MGLLGLLAGATKGRVLGLRLRLALPTGRSFDLEGRWQACGVLTLKALHPRKSDKADLLFYLYMWVSEIQGQSTVGACGFRCPF